MIEDKKFMKNYMAKMSEAKDQLGGVITTLIEAENIGGADMNDDDLIKYATIMRHSVIVTRQALSYLLIGLEQRYEKLLRE